jgi:hypothetical protein
MQPPEEKGAGYEKRDISAGRVALAGASLLLLIGVGTLLSWLTFQFFAGMPQEGGGGAAVVQPLPPAPRLQVFPVKDLQEKRQAEDLRLGSYGWLGEESGGVHIPVERAMDLIVERYAAVGGVSAKPK